MNILSFVQTLTAIICVWCVSAYILCLRDDENTFFLTPDMVCSWSRREKYQYIGL